MAVFQTKLDDDVLRMMGPGFAELVSLLYSTHVCPMQAVLNQIIHMCHSQHPNGKINAMDFHRTREVLVTSADDQCIRVYNTATGKLEKAIGSHKYGASCVRWTHSEYAVVHASTKVCPLA